MTEKSLVARDALTGVCVALSVSESKDLHRLGLMEKHCRLAVAEIARSVFLAGGTIIYGGRLQPEGFTQVLMDEVLRYSDNRQALTICLPWSEHIKISLRDLKAMDKRLGSSARLMLMALDGNAVTVDDMRRVGRPEDSSLEPPRALSAMRKHVTECTQARVLVGGKLSGFQGDMPGVIEEALLSLAAHQPLYVAAGYGGAAAAAARALGHDDLHWAPPDFPQDVQDPEAADALERLAQYSHGNRADDGLSILQRQQLSATHRPGTIAAILVQGLARQFG